MNHDQTVNQDQIARRGEPTSVDAPYTFGRPASSYLAPRQIVRLTILRSKVRESRLQLESVPVDQADRASD